jgi:uncharacterized protein (TIGR00251 family)
VSAEPVARLSVRVQPRAKRSEITGERAGAVIVRVAAPPVDGKANAALCALVAERAGVARSAVTVLRGASGRDKVLEVRGLDTPALRRALKLE